MGSFSISFLVAFITCFLILITNFYIHYKKFLKYSYQTPQTPLQDEQETQEDSKEKIKAFELLSLATWRRNAKSLALGLQAFLSPLRIIAYVIFIIAFLVLLDSEKLSIVGYFIGLSFAIILMIALLYYRLFRQSHKTS